MSSKTENDLGQILLFPGSNENDSSNSKIKHQVESLEDGTLYAYVGEVSEVSVCGNNSKAEYVRLAKYDLGTGEQLWQTETEEWQAFLVFTGKIVSHEQLGYKRILEGKLGMELPNEPMKDLYSLIDA